MKELTDVEIQTEIAKLKLKFLYLCSTCIEKYDTVGLKVDRRTKSWKELEKMIQGFMCNECGDPSQFLYCYSDKKLKND